MRLMRSMVSAVGRRGAMIAILVIAMAAWPDGASCLGQAEQPAEPMELSVDQAVTVLHMLDRTHINVEYVQLPLEQILRALNEVSPVPIRADWLELDLLGIERATLVTLSLPNVSLSTALAALGLQIGDEYSRAVYEYHAGQIVMTTLDASDRLRMTAVYNVRDLLADATIVQRLQQQHHLPPAPAVDPVDAAQDDAPDVDALPRERTPGENLLELIADHVDPDAWIEFGGNRARITEHNGVLMVSAPATVHKKLRDALEQLRRAIPSHVWFEAAVLSVPRATYDMLIRRHRPGTIALGRALMNDEAAMVYWRCRSGTIALGETFRAESKAHEDDGMHALTFVMMATLEQATGVLHLALEVGHAIHDEERSVQSVIACPGSTSAAIVELAGLGAEDNHVRLVVIVPRTG